MRKPPLRILNCDSEERVPNRFFQGFPGSGSCKGMSKEDRDRGAKSAPL